MALQEEKDFIKELINPKTQNVAFQKLLREYQKPLYNLIRNIVLDHDDTNDVLQNTFIKVFQNLKNFKGDSKLFSWMYRIATNEAITFINNKAKRNKTTSAEIQSKLVENLQSDVFLVSQMDANQSVSIDVIMKVFNFFNPANSFFII